MTTATSNSESLLPSRIASKILPQDSPSLSDRLLLNRPSSIRSTTRIASSNFPEAVSEKISAWLSNARRSAPPALAARDLDPTVTSYGSASLPNLNLGKHHIVGKDKQNALCDTSETEESSAKDTKIDVTDSFSQAPSLLSESSLESGSQVDFDILIRALAEVGIQLVMVTKTEMDRLIRERIGTGTA